MWMTEGDVRENGLNFGMYHYTTLEQPEDDNIATANRLARFMLSHRALGEAHIFLYSMHAQDYFAPTPPEWSALVTAEGYLHPSADAHAAFAWMLEDTKFVKTETLASGVYAYYFQNNNRSVAVLSTDPRHADYAIPMAKGVTITDLFGNPITKSVPLDENLIYLNCNGKLPTLERLLNHKK
jgi:hypothetical protein